MLHIGKFYPPVRGGMEQVLASLCQATRGRIDNEVLAFSDSRETRHDVVDGIPVTRLGSISPARSTPIAPAMTSAIRRSTADLIVLHEPNPWGLLSCAIARPAAPLVVYFHSEVVRPALQYAHFYHPIARAVYSRAARIVVASPPMANHAAALQPYKDRISVIPYGTDPEEWAATETTRRRAREIRESFGSMPLALFTGRVVRYKGCDVLLRALKDLPVAAVLAGDGPLREELMTLSAELGLSNRVRFAGEVSPDERLALYHAADVFVLPSVTRAEAFGFVQVEAMACSRPVISTNLGSGVPWVNQHGVTGIVVEPGDVAALREALSSLLSDPSMRDRMGAAARQRVQEQFTLTEMGKRAIALVEELV